MLFTLLVFDATINAEPQPNIKPGNIKGVVLDLSSRAPVVNANIIIIGTEVGAASDLDGEFQILNVKPGTYHLQASALGYIGDVKSEVSIIPGRTVKLEFLLEATAIKGEEVVVRGGFFRPKPDLITSSRALRFEEIRRAPGSAEDVQRAIQALPGVANSNDQNNEIIVRGGSPSENLLVMDGIEIDNINHFPDQSTSGGPIGLVNPEFLKEVTFASGGFSARYGDKLSSVLDLELREGDREQFHGQIMTSMAGIGANVEGGLFNGKGSYLISFRKSYLDLINDAIGLTSVPHYWDLQMKTVYDISPIDKLSVVGLYGNDRIDIETEDGDAWSRGAEAVYVKAHTMVLGGKWRKIWKGGYSNLIFGHTEVYYNVDVHEIDRDPITNELSQRLSWANRSTEITDQLHFTWTGKVRTTDEYSAGITLKPLTFSHDIWMESDTIVYDNPADPTSPIEVISPSANINESTSSLKYGAFMQYRWRPQNNLSLIGGVRLDGFQYSEELTVAPRMSASWEFYPKLTWNAAYGIYYQSHPLMVYTNDPNGGNKMLQHPKASQYVTGLSYLFSDATLFSIEGYYKDYRNLAVSESSLREDTDTRPRSFIYHATGKKWAYGFEFFAQQKLSTNWFGTLSYSYTKSMFDNSIETYPSTYDYRNIGTLVLGYEFCGLPMREFQKNWYGMWTYLLPVNGDLMTLSTRLRYVSGRPLTPQEWTTDGPEYYEHWQETDDLNSERYPEYSRWDVRLDNKWFFGSKTIISFVEVQNVLDRQNIAMYSYADGGVRDDVEQFRFFFVGGVRFEW